MGTALAMTAACHSDNTTYLVGSPLDDDFIHSINSNRWHPTLSVNVPENITALREKDAGAEVIQEADVLVIGVSSPGVAWAVGLIQSSKADPECIALVTKGLVAADKENSAPSTYATALDTQLDCNKLLGIGGPCIARELALQIPTAVSFAATRTDLAYKVREHFQTDFYRVAVHPDFIALEACAALKNFFCIGVAAMLGIWEIDGVTAKNPVAALFNQAVLEMETLSQWIRQPQVVKSRNDSKSAAFDLPGMGDLHVTVGGGRNSKLGTLLGKGQRLSEIIDGPMRGVTVEGLDTGKQLLSGFNHAIDHGILSKSKLPLTACILDCIENDHYFNFDFSCIPTE